MMDNVGVVVAKSIYGKHWKEAVILRDKANPLIPVIYLLKTVHKKEKQHCHSITYYSYFVLFKGKDLILKMLSQVKNKFIKMKENVPLWHP